VATSTSLQQLLVTVTKVEAVAVLQLYANFQRLRIGDKTYYDLGSIQGAKVCMVQTKKPQHKHAYSCNASPLLLQYTIVT